MKRLMIGVLALAVQLAAGAQTWEDVTSQCITNPTFENDYNGWDVSVSHATTYGWTSHCFRFFDSEGSIEQTIQVPEAGVYRISVNAFMRPGDFSDEAVAAHADGSETIAAYLYAGDQQQTLQSLYSDYTTEYLSGGLSDSQGRYYPNGSASAYVLLSQGKYENQVEVAVGADRQLTIGINTGSRVENNWCVMTGWRVEKQKAEQPSGEPRWIDITSEYVVNPDYATNDYHGWEYVGEAGSTATRAGAQEFWQGWWDFSQEIVLPSAGRYRIGVTGYYRPGDNSRSSVQAHENGTEDITCVLYANADEVPLQSVYSAYSQTYLDGGWGYNPSGGGGWGGANYRYYPNTMESGVALFGQGHYQNELTTEVGADRHLTIGIRNWNWAVSNWTLFTGWRLEWYGVEVPATNIVFSKKQVRMTPGETLQLSATVLPANATFTRLSFESSDERIVAVADDGTLTALRTGEATITAHIATGSSTAAATCRITVEGSQVVPGQLVVNEVQQANVDMFIDPSWNFGGWVELYNTSDSPVSLSGLYVSDDPADLRKMHLDSRFGAVPAKGFLNLWFDHYSRWAPAMVNFKLDTDGGTLYISTEDGTIVVQEDYPPAITRTSYARTTDGGDEWGYTDQPTPKASNATSDFAIGRLAAPQPDRDGGLFTGSFTLHVPIPAGAELRYTTDGSTPTRDNGETSTSGRFDISETTILRLRLYQSGWLSSPVVTRSFIYKDQDYTLPVLSVVSDWQNLTGDEYGIFVQGSGNGRPGNGQGSNCNWNMDWDRPANIEFYSEDGLSAFNQEAGIEAAGGWSRAWEPHSFNIKANKIYEGQNRMNYPFFPNKPYLRHKALKVRNGGNDTNDRIKDAAIQEVVRTSGLYVETQSYRPVHVFHNGVYIGVENLREPNNKNYAFANYGIDTDEMDQWKMSPDSGYVQQQGNREAWEELMSLSQSADDALVYERVKELLDVEEYINYLAVELYIGGNDWPQNNIKAFREQSDGQSNSRFRFVLFDTDGALALSSSAFNTFSGKQWYTFDRLYGVGDLYPSGRISGEIEFVTLFLNLLKNEEFKKQFADQFCIVAGAVFEPTRAAEVINAMVAHVNPAMSLEWKSATGSANSVRSAFSGSRQTTMVGAMRSFLGLGSALSLDLSADIDGAAFTLNDLPLPANTFKGQVVAPVTIRAAAPAGYKFAGWKTNQNTTSTAIFAKGSEWNYYDQGSLDGVDWKTRYYTKQWPAGNAPLGYDTGGGKRFGTTLDYGTSDSAKRPTYYFRKQFNLTGIGAADAFTLDWTADDGFVVYVNGKEAGRHLMSNTASPTYADYADTYANDNPDSGTMRLDRTLFNTGTNIIAVELHNNSAGSTDILWDAALSLSKTSEGTLVSNEEEYTIPDGTSAATTLIASFQPIRDDPDNLPVRINEISAANDIYVNDQAKKNDWIELYNTTSAPVDVAGMYLSDNPDKPLKFQIPASTEAVSTVIPAHGHMVVWADKLEPVSQLHANFKLAQESGSVILMAADQSWHDILTYGAHDGAHTVGLYPDGGKELYVMERPTIGAANVLTTAAVAWDEPDNVVGLGVIRAQNKTALDIAFDGRQLIVRAAVPAVRLDIYDTAGRLMQTRRISTGVAADLNTLQAGIYVAVATAGDEQTSLKFTLQ